MRCVRYVKSTKEFNETNQYMPPAPKDPNNDLPMPIDPDKIGLPQPEQNAEMADESQNNLQRTTTWAGS